jgi:hypothetical protein
MELILSSFLMDMAPDLSNRLLTIFMGIELGIYALEQLMVHVYGNWGTASNNIVSTKTNQRITMKTKHGIQFSIVKQEVMWIVRYDWDKSFARIEMNKDVITGQ